MRAPLGIVLSLLAVQLGVPRWMGAERLVIPVGGPIDLHAARVALDPGDPRRRRLGGLTYLGGVALSGPVPRFGGYSALAVRSRGRERVFALLSDRGTVLRFRMGPDWRPRDATIEPLPAGPGTGWTQEERDSEALVVSPAGDRAWVAFERWNEVWRYRIAPDGRWTAECGQAPAAMAGWPDNGGAESMARLPDGRFVILSEGRRPSGRRRGREALILDGDPTAPQAPAARFTYVPEKDFEPADAAALPDGRLLVLERSYALGMPVVWRNRLAMVPAASLRAGAVARGRPVARLEAPLIADNFEGLAVAREGNATILWLVSDDNLKTWQRTLLLKFRLDA